MRFITIMYFFNDFKLFYVKLQVIHKATYLAHNALMYIYNVNFISSCYTIDR